jgi:hypothetical protein
MNGIVVLSVLLAFRLIGTAAAPAQIKIDLQSERRAICGFAFSAVKDMVVVAKPIPEGSLRTRIDNERYDACPYTVILKYKGVPIPLDFSRDVTLERVRNSGEEGPARTAYFTYDESGWGAAGDDIDIARADMTTHEKAGSVGVSGILKRKIQNSRQEDFCFAVVVIGADKYLAGAVCRPKKSTLEPFAALFSKEPIISFEK